MIRVATAGWSYPDWEGVVYPAPRPRGFEPLRFLAGFLDGVEVNSTFYGPPRAAVVERWVRAVEGRPDLRFVVKLHADFTHEPWTLSRDGEARGFLEGIRPLVEAGRLSALLAQFPATFVRSPDAVRRLGRLADLFGGPRLVLELRHRSWFDAEGTAAVAPLGASRAHLDLPAASDHPPEDAAPLGPIGYLRLHGRNRATWFQRGATRDTRYDWLYAPEDVAAIVARARRIEAARAETWVVANNHPHGKAAANAIEIRAALRGGAVPAPAPLVAAFPRLAGVATVVGERTLF